MPFYFPKIHVASSTINEKSQPQEANDAGRK
jgi:hypothetical protein